MDDKIVLQCTLFVAFVTGMDIRKVILSRRDGGDSLLRFAVRARGVFDESVNGRWELLDRDVNEDATGLDFWCSASSVSEHGKIVQNHEREFRALYRNACPLWL